MDANDQGHRYGNFPNYYSFHPLKNRIDVLNQTGIMDYIRRGLYGDDCIRKPSPVQGIRRACRSSPRVAPRETTDSTAAMAKVSMGLESNINCADDEAGSGESRWKKPRTSHSEMELLETVEIYYCDLGCNEGDLTVAMAYSLLKMKCTTNSKQSDVILRSDHKDEKESKTKPESISQAKRRCNVKLLLLGLDLIPS